MITEWLFTVGMVIANWAASLFPDWEAGEDIANVDDSINGLLAMGTGAGAFVDWAYIGVIVGIPLSLWVLGMSVAGIRTLASHIPFFGGRG